MRHHLANEAGSSMVGTAVMLTLIALMGAAVTEVSNSDSASGTNEFQGINAIQIGNAGIEYALDKIDNGESPDVDDKAFANGSFTIVTEPNQQTLAVTAVAGKARKAQTITTDFGRDVMDLTALFATADGNLLQNLELTKDGNSAAILTSLSVKWDFSLCAQNVSCPEDADDSSDDASDDDSSDGGKKVKICHYPSGDTTKGHTISVSSSAVDAHMQNHGDLLGNCPANGSEDDDSDDDSELSIVACEGLDDEMQSCSASQGNAAVTAVKINGQTIVSGLAAQSGQTIDFADIKFTTDQTYLIDEIAFNAALPAGSWYSVTLHFADGSSESQSFKFTGASAEDEDSSDDASVDDGSEDDASNDDGSDDDGSEEEDNGSEDEESDDDCSNDDGADDSSEDKSDKGKDN